jgi:hypothetical protein
LKRDFIDFFEVEPQHFAIHDKLMNWALCVQYHKEVGGPIARIWRMGRPNGRQWHAPELRPEPDYADGTKIEHAVRKLPAPHAYALRWSYVWRTSPMKARRELGVTAEALARLVKDGRSMLKNRLHVA